ncbi:hypothetical protein [Shewanella sp.]|uniref:acyltransferase n=1 Tax=Shewanella sp. TaxID=50422 RepID=UPI0035639FC4
MNALIKKQILFIIIWLSNLVTNFLPFFRLKNAFMRFQGAKIGQSVSIHTPVKFFGLYRNLFVGDNVTVNPNCYLDDRGSIYLGNNVNISHSVRIYTAGHDIRTEDMAYFERSVSIGDDVWIFPNVIIMPGVKLSERCIVLPGSVVTKSFGSGSIIGGNPATVISTRTADVNYKIEHGFWFVN